MPFETSYSEKPEPNFKLLNLDCFPTFFPPPTPPPYQAFMASTRYHRLPEDTHASFDSVRNDNDNDNQEQAELLLGNRLSPIANPPSKETKRKFTYHPTLFLRFIVTALLIASVILFLIARRPRTKSAIVFNFFVIIRNILVIMQHFVTKVVKIEISLRNRISRSGISNAKKRWPSWLKHGLVHVAIDLFLAGLLLITVFIATQGSYNWFLREAVPACILSWVSIPLYVLCACDMGKPSTVTGTISFDYGSDVKDPERQEQPQVYRDVEAAGALQARKTGADSPVVI